MLLDERQVSVKSALEDVRFHLQAFSGREELSQPYRYTLELLSEQGHIQAEQLLGTEMVLNLELSALKNREFTGFVTRFERLGRQGRYFSYRAVLVPWLGLMKYRSDCRIFADQAVPDIFGLVSQNLGIPVSIEMKLGGFPTRPYTVQYRETDFNFVSRLLEEEGIYYHFLHSGGHHSIMLTDAVAKLEPAPDYPSIPYYPPTGGRRDEEHISSWDVNRNMVPGNAALNDYDYQYQQVALATRANDPQGHANDHFEMFDYPGGYTDETHGRQAIAVSLERLQADREFIHFKTNARGLYPGATFRVRGLDDVSESENFLAVRADYVIQSNGLESGGPKAGTMLFSASFIAMTANREYRPQRRAKKPLMQGPHSAVVTGPTGVEIYTDPDGLGRVLVQFHWDRYADSTKNNTSCWVRVSQPWAGAGFGAVQIPRVGEEVLVDFLDGDPDRPVIVGRLYNGKNRPPYKLPDNATQSGVKTHSSPKGHADNFNEIRFEDRKGHEELYVQAERDHKTLVKHDQTLNVGHNRSKTVDGNEQSTIYGDRTEHVLKGENGDGGNDVLTVDLNRTVQIHGDAVMTIDGQNHHTVGKNEKIEVVGKQDETIGKGRTLTITEGGDHSDVTGPLVLKLTGDHESKVSGKEVLNVGKTLEVVVKENILFKCGSSSIMLSKDGDVVIEGKNVVIKSKGGLTARADGDLILSGPNVLKN
ncbi:MAG: type VI secretion system tip protein TssI/VgrG [Deltaproteobacteria bacterium]|nr:type VI secretion system tip protein TssI/VgrG [Deltaproteobacteria bacterium]